MHSRAAGALVWWNGGFHRVADPFRHFGDGVASVPNPVGTPLDKVLVGLFRLKCLLKSPEQIFAGPETSTLARLQASRSVSSAGFCETGRQAWSCGSEPLSLACQTSCWSGMQTLILHVWAPCGTGSRRTVKGLRCLVSGMMDT